MIEMYKHINQYNKDILSPNFRIKTRPPRQHKFQLFTSRTKDGIRGVRSTAFYQRAIPIWNSLPKEVDESKTLNSFKSNLDKAWFEMIYLER